MENREEIVLRKYEKLNFSMVMDDMWKEFKKFYILFFLSISVCASIFYMYAKISYEPVYEAYSSFVVNTRSAYGYSDTYYNQTALGQLNHTFPYILTSGVLEKVIAESLGMEDKVPATITTEVVADTALFTIRVRAKTPQLAYDVLQSTIENYPKVAEYIIGDTQLVKMDESGMPEKELNPPQYKKSALIGIGVGTIIFMWMLFLYVINKKTIRKESDLEAQVNVSCLGNIPKVKSKRRTKKQPLIFFDQGSEDVVLRESLRAIRSRLINKMEYHGTKRILITSAAVGEGKTTIAVNLALSLTKKGKKVVLIDGDLRNPSVAKAIGLKEVKYGTADILRGKVDEEEAVISYKDTMLRILPGAAPMNNPGNLLGSKRMEQMLNVLSEDADYVIVDTPPCGILADASIIARYVEKTILVVRQDYVKIDKIRNAVERIADVGTELVGFVLNSTELGITGYGYGYGRSYGYGHIYGYGYGYGRTYGYGHGYGRTYGYGYGYGEQEK